MFNFIKILKFQTAYYMEEGWPRFHAIRIATLVVAEGIGKAIKAFLNTEVEYTSVDALDRRVGSAEIEEIME